MEKAKQTQISIVPGIGDLVEFWDWVQIRNYPGTAWTQVRRRGVVKSYRQSTGAYYIKTEGKYIWIGSDKIITICNIK